MIVHLFIVQKYYFSMNKNQKNYNQIMEYMGKASGKIVTFAN